MRNDLGSSCSSPACWDEHTVFVVTLTGSGCSVLASLSWGTVVIHGKCYLFDLCGM